MCVKKVKTSACKWDFEVRHLNATESEALVPCYVCKNPHWVRFPVDEYGSVLQHSLLMADVCSSCIQTGTETEKTERAKAIQEEKDAKAAKLYEERIVESRLAKNYIAWDSSHKGANNDLFGWVQDNYYGSMLLTGETGLCKTRVLQHFGREQVKAGKRVFYSPASLMLNEISSAFAVSCADGDKLVEKLFVFDLLIIDDLGKEIGSNSQVGRLWDIVDRRYLRYEQEKEIQAGKIDPLYAKNLDRSHGWQLWVSTNLNINDIFNKYEKNYNRAGDPLLNRLRSMCKVWTPPENGSLRLKD